MTKPKIALTLILCALLLQGCSSSSLNSAKNRVAISGLSFYLGFHSSPVMYVKRGYAYSDLGGVKNRQRAISDYNTAIMISPRYAFAYQARGVSRALLGDYKLAIEDFNQCIRIAPLMGGCYRNRGWVHSEYLKDYEAGLVDSDLSVKYLPRDPVSYANRAENLFMLGIFPESCANFRKAFELGYSLSETWTNDKVKRFASDCKS